MGSSNSKHGREHVADRVEGCVGGNLAESGGANREPWREIPATHLFLSCLSKSLKITPG